MAVVSEVRNTGHALTRIDSAIAALRSSPRPIPSSVVATTWTEWATATVITMMGTPELAGLNTVPRKPAKPTVVLTANISTATIATVPSTERRSSAATTVMTANVTGTKVSRSSVVASAKARLSGTSPVR